MIKVLVTLSILALSGFATAADQPAPTPVPAQTTVSTPAGPVITWSGLAMIRLREDIIRNRSAVGDTIRSSNNYSNRLAYRFGAKFQANPQVSFMFEIGNEWYATEVVNGGNSMTTPSGLNRKLLDPMFLQAWAMWDPGFLHLQVGIDPVKGSSTMDLIGMSLLFNKNYTGLGFQACQLPWGTTNNFLYPGLRIGAPILKGDFKLGVDLFSGIAEERPVATLPIGKDSVNYSAILNIIDVPMNVGSFSVAPQFVLILNRNFRDAIGSNPKRDNEIGAGFDAGYKLNDIVNFRAGFGFATISNKNTKTTTETPYDRRGTNVTLGSSIKAGPGKIDVDLNFGTNNDTEIKDNLATYEFFDLKYAWGVAKNFTIMPRARVYLSQVPVAGVDNKASNARVWPELILFGAF